VRNDKRTEKDWDSETHQRRRRARRWL